MTEIQEGDKKKKLNVLICFELVWLAWFITSSEKKTTQNIRAALPSTPDYNCGPRDGAAAPVSSSKGKTSSVSGVNGYPAHRLFFFLFFFSSWISTDTPCHLKTIFPTASVHTEGNYHLANQVRQTHGDFFGSHDLLRDLCLSHSLESVTCFGFIQYSTVSSAAFAQQYFNGNIFRS